MKDKKYTTNQRIKRIEKAIGELYVMIHHIAGRLDPEPKVNPESRTDQTWKNEVLEKHQSTSTANVFNSDVQIKNDTSDIDGKQK